MEAAAGDGSLDDLGTPPCRIERRSIAQSGCAR
jgi:hypothetical protein